MTIRDAMPSDEGTEETEIREDGPIATNPEGMLSFMWKGTPHKVIYYDGVPCIEIGFGTYAVFQERGYWNIKPVVMEQLPFSLVES